MTRQCSTTSKVNLKYLQKVAPTWQWKPVRDYGIGWNYEGKNGERNVTVRPYSHLSGYSDDDYYTVWHANEDSSSETLTWWLLQQGFSQI